MLFSTIFSFPFHRQFSCEQFGGYDPMRLRNIVKQDAVQGSELNNSSLDRVCKGGYSQQTRCLEIKPMKFVDDIVGPNSDEMSTKLSDGIVK